MSIFDENDPNLPIYVMTIYDEDGNIKGFVRLLDKNNEVCHNCNEKGEELKKCAKCRCAMYCNKKSQKSQSFFLKKYLNFIFKDNLIFKYIYICRLYLLEDVC